MASIQRDPKAVSFYETEGSSYDELLSGTGVTLRVYGVRWHMLAIFCSNVFANAFIWCTFAPISSYTRQYFDVTDTLVNVLSLVYMGLYLPGSLLSAWLIDSFDLRYNVFAAAAFNLVGAGLRLLGCFFAPAPAGFAVLLVGQCVAAMGQPLLTNTPAKVSGTWFPHDEQNLAMTFAALVSPLGNACAQVVPSLIVGCDTDGPCPRDAIKGFVVLMVIQAAFCTVVGLWTLVFFRHEPEYAPSEAAQHRRYLRQSLRESREVEPASDCSSEIRLQTAACCKNRQFLLLLAGFGTGLGLFQAFLTLVEQIIRPVYWEAVPSNGTALVHYRLDENSAQTYSGIYGGMLIVTGLLTAAVVGPVLDRTHAFKTILRISLSGAIGVLVFLFMVLQPGTTNAWLVAAGFAFLGAFMIPILPTALEAGVECTFPVPEEYSSGLLMLSGQVMGIALTLAMPVLIDMKPNWYSWDTQWTPFAIFTVAMAAFGGIFMFCFNGENKKTERNQSGRA